MNFNEHFDLRGEHAYLSASSYHWINYDDEKIITSYLKYLSIHKGIRLHDFARQCIELGINLPKTKRSLNQYVNDAIGFRMIPEQILFYSHNCFGTADAISFRESEDFLRIHDLKTGSTRVSMRQLEVYAALFCLEYDYNPKDLSVELRIYQSNDIIVYIPEHEDINRIINKIVLFDKKIEQIKEEEKIWKK